MTDRSRRLRQPSVGRLKPMGQGPLNGTCDRHPACGQQVVKCRNQLVTPLVAQARCHLAPQCRHPVPLPAGGKSGQIPDSENPLREAVADGADGGLEAREVPLGAQPDNTAALRAAIAAQVDPRGQVIKIGQRKPVSPRPHHPAPGAALRTRPGIISLALEKMLEIYRHKDYHSSRFWWDHSIDPGCFGGGRSCELLRPFLQLKRPHPRGPFNSIISACLSIFSEKIPLIQAHRFWHSTVG